MLLITLHRTALIILLVLLLDVGTALAGRANIFIYHRFGESRYPSTNISIEKFESHLEYLFKNNIPVLPLSEVIGKIRNKIPLPESCVVLTVDDAFDSFNDRAMPILRKYKFPVALFVNSDAVGTNGYLGWEKLAQLRAEGVEIGNHSATHDYLLERLGGESEEVWRSRVREDILRADKAFSDNLGFRPNVFAYPYGEYSTELVEIVRLLGFKAALAQQSGVAHDQSNIFILPRFPMGGPYATLDQFRSKAGMHPLKLEVVSPASPVLGAVDPPEMLVRIDSDIYATDRMNAFVQGDNRLHIKPVQGEQGLFRVVAEESLTSRRNKYTITAPLRMGGWAWFSQPWFRLKSKL